MCLYIFEKKTLCHSVIYVRLRLKADIIKVIYSIPYGFISVVRQENKNAIIYGLLGFLFKYSPIA